jgi:signal transduction histidine kinase
MTRTDHVATSPETARQLLPANPMRPVGWIVVGATALAMFCVQVPVSATLYGVPVLVALVVAMVSCGSLVLAAHAPRAGAAVHLVSVLALAVVTAPTLGVVWPVAPTAVIGLAILFAIIGMRTRWQVTAFIWAASGIVIAAIIAATPIRYGDTGTSVPDLFVTLGNTLLVGIAAVLIGQRRNIRAELASARRDVELEQARRRTVEERARLARELHDVVAHSMSVVHMRAQSAQYRLPDLSEEARQEFDGIADTARAALGEMRQLLGTLRADDDAERAPQPQLADLSRLAETTTAAGCRTTLRIDETALDLAPVVQLAAYRTVQEALGNVVRHARAAAATVQVNNASGVLHIVVENTAVGESTPPDRGGHGLRGMRERIEALGGSLEHGPLPGGGYRLSASIPVDVAAGENA